MAASHPNNGDESPAADSTTTTPFSFEAFKRQSPWFAVPWDARVKELQRSVGYAAGVGALIGAMTATTQYFDGAGPEKTLRGLLRREVPKYTGRVAGVALAMRLSFWGVDIVRGSHVWERDIFIAAPIAGVLYGARKGPKGAAVSAMIFAGAGVGVYGLDAAYRYYKKQNSSRETQDPVEYQAQDASGAPEEEA